MTQPAQSSEHEWVMDYPNVPLGHCTCGYGRTFGESGIDPEQYAAHVALVAQPPAYLHHATEHKDNPHPACSYCKDAFLNAAAQPQEVPAEQRDSELAAQYDNGYRFGLHKALTIWQGSNGSMKLGAFLREELKISGQTVIDTPEAES